MAITLTTGKLNLKKATLRSGMEILKLIAAINLEIANHDRINITNESTFLDEHNEIQFLRHSISLVLINSHLKCTR